jgi:hypothetical protein
MKLKYRAAVNCTLFFDIDAETEDQAQDIAEQVIEELAPSVSPQEMIRALVNPSIDIDETYPDIHEN